MEIYIQVFKRLVATSRAPQIMVLSMFRSFGKIRPQIDQIWVWLSRGHPWSPGVRNPLKSSVTGPSLLVNCYLEIKFHKIIRVNSPAPPPPPLRWFGIIEPKLVQIWTWLSTTSSTVWLRSLFIYWSTATSESCFTQKSGWPLPFKDWPGIWLDIWKI